VSVGQFDQLRLWDVASRTAVIALPRSGVGREEDGIFEVEVAFNEVSFTPDGRMVAAADEGMIPSGEGFDSEFAFSPDGGMLVTGGPLDGRAWLWDARRHTRIGPPLSSGEGLWDVAFSPDGTTFAGAGTDGTVRLWDVSGGTPLARPVLRDHTDIVESGAFTPAAQKGESHEAE
jgi:WD40 repeat protein